MEAGVNSTCRGCMSTIATDLHPIFNDGLPELYNSLTSLNISTDDGLPTVICTVCKSSLQTFTAFKLKCIESYSTFMKRLVEAAVKIEKNDFENDEKDIQNFVDEIIDDEWHNSDDESMSSKM